MSTAAQRRTNGTQLRSTTQAYDACRQIARREAKNFYYAFLALPRPKSDAMCAMYAFMRRADDIADDETLPIAQRRVLLEEWRQGFQTGRGITPQDDVIFLAVRDTQRTFGIADSLLQDLVDGTAMDLAEALPPGVERRTVEQRPFDCYQTVEVLDRYCYLVASVVGLVTVRIFGVQGNAADADAIRMGKAFQYTNILRDVREDAERGRIYLPLDLLHTHGAEVSDVVDATMMNRMSPGLRSAMADLGNRAQGFYQSEQTLLPLLARDSRPAMRVLIHIYHALLLKMRRRQYSVFADRMRVSTPRKLAILARGLLGSLVSRIV